MNEDGDLLLTGALLLGGGVAGYLAGRWLFREGDARAADAPPGTVTAPEIDGPGPVTSPEPADPSPRSTSAPLPRTIDPIFERYRGPIPIEYLRALSMRESGMNPRSSSGPARGLMQIVEVVRESYNDANHTRYARPDLFDPEVNVAMGCWLLRHIIASYAKHHPQIPNLKADWSNPRFVGLLTIGWTAGYSERGGVGRVARFLEAREVTDLTIDIVHDNAEGAGASRHLRNPKKVRWSKGVVALYLRERALASEPSPHTQRRPDVQR